MPPPTEPAVLPERVELVTVRLPELLKAPPLLEVFAPETVTPEINRLPPGAMLKILKPPWLPSMVSKEAPRPMMVTVPAVPIGLLFESRITEVASIMVGNAAAKVMG